VIGYFLRHVYQDLSNMAGDIALQNIQQEAMKLLHVALSCPVGAHKFVYNSQPGGSYSKLLALTRWALLNSLH